MYSIGIDLGGTNIAVAVISDTGVIERKISVTTPKKIEDASSDSLAEKVAETMAKATERILNESGTSISAIKTVGIGAPGIIDTKTQTIGYWSNLDLHNVPLGRLYARSLKNIFTDTPEIYLENDANVAALGEFYAGVGRNSASLVAITLGTGVGGGAIVHGKLLTGFNNAAMEVGHFVIESGGTPCTCGRLGCFEAYSSATALIRQTKEAMEGNKSSQLWEIVGNDIESVNGKTVFDGVELGDAVSKKVLESYLSYLACGISNLVNLFQPEILCIGGGLAGQKDALLTPLLALVNQEDYAKNLSKRTKVTLATLGNDAGLIGTAFLPKVQGK